MKLRVPHRPYSQINGTEPSVTTILELLPKPGLSWGAARETALFAYLHPDKWEHLAIEEAVNVLRLHHKGVWDGRAGNGTVTHDFADLYWNGFEVDVVQLIENAKANEPKCRTWKERDTDDLIEMVLGYTLGVEQFFEDFQPTKCLMEAVVRWPGLFIGQTDLHCVIDGEPWLLDWKTTGKQDEGDGIYNDSWTLQIAMYGMARERVLYEMREDRKLKSGVRPIEIGTEPWSRPKRYGIVHLRGDERYTLFEVKVDREVERAALRLARAYPTWQRLEKSKPSIVRPRVAEAVA